MRTSRVARAEPRVAIGRHRHDAIRRQRLGQRDVHARLAVGVGRDRAKPEREHAEVLAERAGAGICAAATAVGLPLRCQHAARHDALAAVFVEHLERLPDVDRSGDVGRLIGGQREHTVVDRPQRDFAGGAALR